MPMEGQSAVGDGRDLTNH